MRVTLSINKKEQDKLIEYMIGEIFRQMNERIKRAEKELNSNIKSYVKDSFFKSSAYHSLVNGELREELGLDDQASANLSEIINEILEKCQTGKVYVKPYAKEMQVSYIWKFLEVGYNDLISLKGSSYISDQMKHWSGTKIPWLEWLLKGCPGVKGYYVARVSEDVGKRYNSRSGRALMFRATGRTWKLTVNENLTGGLNENDNFLTKIFDNIGLVITQEVDRILSV